MGAITKKNISLNSCPECGGTIIPLIETGDIVCNQCGLVIHEKNVDYNHSGRRAYTKGRRVRAF